MDRLTELEVFTRVVEEKSFTAAATKLGMSRAMVSKYMIALEQRLGARLLNRTTRRLSLTEVGRQFFDQTVAIISALAEAEATVSQTVMRPQGSLRINAPMSFGLRHMGSAIKDYLDRYDDVSIDLDLNDRMIDLVDEGYDLAIRIGNLADSSLRARKLANIRMVVCASPGYIKRFGAPQSPNELKGHSCLTYSYQSAPQGWRFEMPEGVVVIKPEGRFRANNGDLIKLAAETGLGIAWLPTFIASDALKDGRLKPILTGCPTPVHGLYAVYPESRFLPPKVRSFIDFLVGHFGPEPYWDRLDLSID